MTFHEYENSLGFNLFLRKTRCLPLLLRPSNNGQIYDLTFLPQSTYYREEGIFLPPCLFLLIFLTNPSVKLSKVINILLAWGNTTMVLVDDRRNKKGGPKWIFVENYIKYSTFFFTN